MHNLEYGLFAISAIIEKELGNDEIAEWVLSLASASHHYIPWSQFEGFDDKTDERLGNSGLIETIRQRADPILHPDK